MRIALLTALALATLASPLSEKQADAQFRFSNRTSKTIYVTYVKLDRSCTGVPWKKRGWWKIAPGNTVTVDGTPIRNRYSYFYAESADGNLKWTNSSPKATITNRVFDLCWNETPAPPTRRVGLRKIDAGSSTKYTVNLTAGSSPPPTPTIKTVRVVVHRHATVSLSAAQADRILADMGGVLQQKDQSNDVATAIRFVRNGAVRVLPSSIPGVIQTQSQLSSLLAVGSGVKIVRGIRWCGGPGGSIIGCAPVGSSIVNIAAVRFTTSQEGILWAHEYGHNVGLSHRTNDANAVMYPSIAPNRRVVNQSESQKYLAGPEAATDGSDHGAHGADGLKKLKIEEFVLQHYFSGVPRKAARSAYTEKDSKRLLQMLANPGDSVNKYLDNDRETEETVSAYLPEIVSTLCFIGGDKAVDPLIAFVKRQSKSKSEFDARNAALIHLGDLVNRTDNQKALGFLMSIAKGRESTGKLITSQLQQARASAAKNEETVAPSASELIDELAVSATQGLAISGKESAEEFLAILKDKGNITGGIVSPAVNQAAAQAEEFCKCAREEGLEALYERLDSNHEMDEPAAAEGGDSIDVPATVDLPAAAAAPAGGADATEENPGARTEAEIPADADGGVTEEELPGAAAEEKAGEAEKAGAPAEGDEAPSGEAEEAPAAEFEETAPEANPAAAPREAEELPSGDEETSEESPAEAPPTDSGTEDATPSEPE